MASSTGKVIGAIVLLLGLLFLFYGTPLFIMIRHFGPFFNSPRPGAFHFGGGPLPFTFLTTMLPWLLMLFTIIMSIWVVMDAEKHGMNGLLWGLLVFVGSFVGLIVYLLVRSNQRETNLHAGYLRCPNCGKPVDVTWTACPYCKADLAPTCPSCGRRVQNDWQVCPYCKTELHS